MEGLPLPKINVHLVVLLFLVFFQAVGDELGNPFNGVSATGQNRQREQRGLQIAPRGTILRRVLRSVKRKSES